MAIDHDEADRIADEERPGSELESALLEDTLGDAMSSPGIILDENAALTDALRMMCEQRRGCVLLVSGGKLTGIFTERDVLLKLAGKPVNPEQTPVSTYMTRDPVTLPGSAGVAYALNLMVVEGFRHIPLVDAEQRPIGVVSMRDLTEYLCGFFPREVLNLPPHPDRWSFRGREGA